MNSANKTPARSPGNEGSRGSRGIGNSGARPDEAGDEPQSSEQRESETRDTPAQGGGGIGSNSDRSR